MSGRNFSLHRKYHLTLILAFPLLLSSCAQTSNILNPFYEPPAESAYLGNPNDSELNQSSQKDENARQALDHLASYQRALPPKPQAPVMQPAVVRLMWIPDHLNRNGDLIPAHYYYLKVLKDRWNLTDAFEIEGQLGASTPSASDGSYVTSKDDLAR
jgi:hypothetical protein